MNPLSVGLIVFVSVFGGAMFAMYLGRVLPQELLSSGAWDVIKVSMTVVATLAAVVLGLLTASAKSSLDDREKELRTVAVQVILLDRTMAKYGQETADARILLKQMLAERINLIWPEENAATIAPEEVSRGTGVESVQDQLLVLSPKNDSQRWLQSKALQITGDIEAARWSLIGQISSTIQWPFLMVVVFWLAAIFANFALFAPPNISVTAALFVAALSVAGSVFMIVEMDQPYSGLVKVSSTPLQIALAELGR